MIFLSAFKMTVLEVGETAVGVPGSLAASVLLAVSVITCNS